MRSLINILFACILLFTGCSKDSSSSSGETLSVDLTKVELAGGGESKVITVTTDGVWKAVCSEADTTWCTLVVEGNKLTVTALANASEKTRTTRITISAEGATPCQVEVSQKPSAFPGLPAEVTLSVGGKEQTFIVLTERKLTFSKPDDAAWCTVTIVGNQVYFSAVKNTGGVRQTVVTISDGIESAKVTVKQRMPSEANYAVGDLFKEDDEVTGVVAYVDEEGWGIVLALDELSCTHPTVSAYWGYYSVLTLQISTTEDDGQKNMETWRAQPLKDAFKAFKLCEEKNKNGVKDWFLASKDEWINVYAGISAYGLEKFNKVIKDIPNAMAMTTRCYWSSTESSTFTNAVYVNFVNGTTGEEAKITDSKCSIRAVRKFE